jgi:DNA-binding NtrC family response regulator
VIISDSENLRIEESWLAGHSATPHSTVQPFYEKLAGQEREMIEAALAESNGKVSGPRGAAAKLGIPQSTLDSKIKTLKISKQRFRRA